MFNYICSWRGLRNWSSVGQCFQIEGNRCSSYEQFKIIQIGRESNSAYSLSIQDGILSGPDDLKGFNDFSILGKY